MTKRSIAVLLLLAACHGAPNATPGAGRASPPPPEDESETTKAGSKGDGVTVSFPTPRPDAPVEWTGIPMISADGATIAISQTRRPTPHCEVSGALFAPVAVANPVTGEWLPFYIGTGCSDVPRKAEVNARLAEGKFTHITLHSGWPTIQLGPVVVKVVASQKAFTLSMTANGQPTKTVSTPRTGTGAPTGAAATAGGLVFVSLDAVDAPTTTVALPTVDQ